MTDTLTIERERYARARSILFDYDLEGLLAKHEQAIEDYMEARRQHAEAKRFQQDIVDQRATVELDALLEMEQDPNYVPGKNAEQRKQQAEVWLAKHREVIGIKDHERAHRIIVDQHAIEAEHARARVDHLELQIAARRTELDLIASFARGAS